MNHSRGPLAAAEVERPALDSWRQNAASLVSLASPEALEALGCLGRTLVMSGMVSQGHACLAAAGSELEFFSSAAFVPLLGCSPTDGRGRWTLERLHASLMYEGTLGQEGSPLVSAAGIASAPFASDGNEQMDTTPSPMHALFCGHAYLVLWACLSVPLPVGNWMPLISTACLQWSP